MKKRKKSKVVLETYDDFPVEVNSLSNVDGGVFTIGDESYVHVVNTAMDWKEMLIVQLIISMFIFIFIGIITGLDSDLDWAILASFIGGLAIFIFTLDITRQEITHEKVSFNNEEDHVR